MRVRIGLATTTALLLVSALVGCNPGNQQSPGEGGPTRPPEGEQTEIPGTDPSAPGTEEPESPGPAYSPTQRLPKPTLEIPPPMY